MRFTQLDALRGIAAFSVGLSHHLTALSSPSHHQILTVQRVIKWSPLYPFAAGYESVVLFFVLSGFVLTLPYTAGTQDRYPVFALRRVMRLYPPYLASVLLSFAAAISLYSTTPGDVSSWFQSHWSTRPEAHIILDHALMVHHFNSSALNPVLWSLVVEMRLSLAFPLIAAASALKPRMAVLSVAACTAIRIAGGRLFHGDLGIDLLDTVEFTGMFIVGGLLARHHEALVARVRGMRRGRLIALFAAGWLAYAYGRVLTHLVAPLGDWVIMIGVAILIVVAISTRSAAFLLQHRAAAFIGRISYSYYLIHVVVLFTLVRESSLHGVSATLAALASIPAGVLAATILYELVERPSLAAGRWIAGRLRRV